MKHPYRAAELLLSVLILASWMEAGSAQQIYGTPGSPSATMTIDGQQLPPPPQKFGGKIERNAAQSKPYWPPRVVPPKGAPNVLLDHDRRRRASARPAPSAA